MNFAVVSRVWRGETPYVSSWARYYLQELGFDKIIIIRCDEEKFGFLRDEFGDMVEFRDNPAHDEQGILEAITKFDVPKQFDFVLSCDIDEYLILPDKIKIQEFVSKNRADHYFFLWILCCCLESGVSDLRDNLAGGVSVGHDGKSLVKTESMVRFLSEHEVQMIPGAVSLSPNLNSAFMLHFCCRGMEDLVIKSLWQGIKVEKDKDKYLRCLSGVPMRFEDLPYRFKIAYFQKSLKKLPFTVKIPSLPVDTERLGCLFKETGLDVDFKAVFEKNYCIGHVLERYPRIPFWEAAQAKSMIKIL